MLDKNILTSFKSTIYMKDIQSIKNIWNANQELQEYILGAETVVFDSEGNISNQTITDKDSHSLFSQLINIKDTDILAIAHKIFNAKKSHCTNDSLPSIKNKALIDILFDQLNSALQNQEKDRVIEAWKNIKSHYQSNIANVKNLNLYIMDKVDTISHEVIWKALNTESNDALYENAIKQIAHIQCNNEIIKKQSKKSSQQTPTNVDEFFDSMFLNEDQMRLLSEIDNSTTENAPIDTNNNVKTDPNTNNGNVDQTSQPSLEIADVGGTAHRESEVRHNNRHDRRFTPYNPLKRNKRNKGNEIPNTSIFLAFDYDKENMGVGQAKNITEGTKQLPQTRGGSFPFTQTTVTTPKYRPILPRNN